MSVTQLTTALTGIAAGQRGFITRAQVVAAGADGDDLRRAARGGWLVREGHGLYRVTGAGVRANDELYAAWLRLAPDRYGWQRLGVPDAIVAGASAAAVYGIGDVPERVHECIVSRRTQTRDPEVRLHLRRDSGAQRWRVADDLPVQEPADAAAWILDHGEGDPAHVGQLMREAITTGLADPSQAERALGPVARRWNVHLGTLLPGNLDVLDYDVTDYEIPRPQARIPKQAKPWFWDITDPRLAVLVSAVVGGTPAYRRQFVRNDAPHDMTDFDDWVCRTVLNPEVPLFREARYLLAEEVEARDPGLYHSVLAAIAGGRTTNGGIAAYIGRTSAEIAHPLNVLQDSHLVSRRPDVFRKGRSTYQIAEPLITFYQAVMRPRWAILELGHARRVWPRARQAFLSQVAGPRFEQICRDWALFADDTCDEPPAEVGAGVVADPADRAQIEVDVCAFAATAPGERRRVLCLGEAKWGRTMGLRDLSRLARARDLLQERGSDTTAARLACFSGSGFDDDLREAAAGRADVLLVDPGLLYA